MQSITNKVQLIGRFGIDPKVKEGKTGKMLRTKLATDSSYRDKQGNKVEETQWHTLVAWNKTAELGEKWFKKGKQVAVEGSLVNRTYEDKDGKKLTVTEVRLDQFMLLGKNED